MQGLTQHEHVHHAAHIANHHVAGRAIAAEAEHEPAVGQRAKRNDEPAPRVSQEATRSSITHPLPQSWALPRSFSGWKERVADEILVQIIKQLKIVKVPRKVSH